MRRFRNKLYARIPGGEIQYGLISHRVTVWFRGRVLWEVQVRLIDAYRALFNSESVLIHSHFWACGAASPDGSGERCGKPVGHEPEKHVSVEGSEWRAALPATESAQPNSKSFPKKSEHLESAQPEEERR